MSTATLKPGTRVNASAYTGQHGTITGEHHREPAYRHAITGDPMPETVWYDVRLDNGTRELLDASRFTLADGFDCASCAAAMDDAGREYLRDADVPHVHCKRCDAAVLDRQTHCAWCGEHRSAREPMPGTFAAWLGDREAVSVTHRAAPRPSTVPAGCPRGLGEGDRTRRIWTDPSGVLAFGDVREYGDMLAADRARGYGRVLDGTGAACARSAGSARGALRGAFLPISGVSDPGACCAARAARMARQTAGATA